MAAMGGATGRKAAPDPTAVLRSHQAPVHCVEFLPDGRLCSGDGNGVVKIWDLESRRPSTSWQLPTDPQSKMKGVLTLKRRLDGSGGLTSQTRDGTVIMWDLGQGEPVPVQALSTQSYHFCKVAPCRSASQCGLGEEAATSSSDMRDLLLCPTADTSKFELWDLRAAARPSHTFQPPGDDKTGVCMGLCLLSRPGAYALAGFENGCLYAYDLRTMAFAFQGQVVSETLMCFDVGVSGRRGVVGTSGTQVAMFDVDWEQHRFVYPSPSFAPQSHGEAPASSEAAVATDAAASDPMDGATREPPPTQAKPQQGPGGEAAVESREGAMRWALKHEGVGDVRVRDDERLWALGGWDHRVRLFSLKTGAPLAVLRCHSESIYGLAFHESLLASASKDHKVALWEGLYPPTS